MTDGVVEVSEQADAVLLARHLNSARGHPVVVITVPAGRTSSYIDVDEVADNVGDLAEIYVIHAGEESWAFSREMAPNTQVYGGAGRVYPVGTEWVTDLRRSPLRFAFDRDQGRAATRALVSDALAMANTAGLLEHRPKASVTRVEGEVKGLAVDRAVVRTTVGMAAVAAELVVPGVPIDRLLCKDQRVTGLLSADKRLDVREMLRAPDDALGDYAVRSVVLARVDEVHAERAILSLHPDVSVELARTQVTSNDLDELTALLTVGEVVRARLVGTGPDWALELYDVDDDEPVAPACALTVGGPPWLVEESTTELRADPPVSPDPVVVQPGPAPTILEPEVPPATVDEPETKQSFIGTPLHLDPHRDRRTPHPPPRTTPPTTPAATTPTPHTHRPVPGPPPSKAVPTTTTPRAPAPVDAKQEQRLRGELDRARAHVAHLEMERKTFLQQQDLQAEQANEDRRRIESLEDDLRELKRKLRKTRTKGVAEQVERAADWFSDPEEQFRYDVHHSWVRRVPAAEKTQLPLPDYDIGPAFLQSLAEVQGIDQQKVADVVVEVLTGRAKQLSGRLPHVLRRGSGGDDPAVRREDGATCWRVALQVNSPAARRLHYWVLPGGRVALSRVVTHDRFQP